MKKEKRNYLTPAEVLDEIKKLERFGRNTSIVPERAYKNDGLCPDRGLVSYTYTKIKRGKNTGMYHPTPINYAS